MKHSCSVRSSWFQSTNEKKIKELEAKQPQCLELVDKYIVDYEPGLARHFKSILKGKEE